MHIVAYENAFVISRNQIF